VPGWANGEKPYFSLEMQGVVRRGGAGVVHVESAVMLEQQTLLLRTWTPGPTARRPIVEPATGELLGFAGWQTSGAVFLWSWLRAPVLEVHEAEDEPLLCTLHRYWSLGTLWAVRDADGRAIASVRRGFILDPFGCCLAAPLRGTRGVSFHDPERQEMATVIEEPEGTLLTFAEELRGEPFAKMALLAAALTMR
jgi:hypothetical protein